ncbi:hypothetical protein FOA52_007698 [Chlamydomonas sp. UWO 241]|nr:hypothetical protein FOA52_007698 [Chlamydomonas sp. UWO 241]
MKHQVVEVSASSAPRDVVGAIVGSAAPPKAPNNPIRFFQLALVFILVFAGAIYYREEIYTFSKEVGKRPILEAVENEQLHNTLGAKWDVVTGSDSARPIKKAKPVSLPSIDATEALPMTGPVDPATLSTTEQGGNKAALSIGV